MSVFKGLSIFGKFKRRSLRRLRLTGDVAQRQRDWSKASESYRQYLSHRPNDAPIWVQLGHGLKELKRFGEAETAYRRALRAAPGNADAQLHLTALLQALDRSDEGTIPGHEFDSRSATPVHIHLGDADSVDESESRRGDIARDQKSWRSAALFYSEHLIKHPDDGAIWVQLGHMLKESSLFEDAVYAYQVGKRLEGETSDVSLHLASLLMHIGRSEEAKPLWADLFQKEGTFFFHSK